MHKLILISGKTHFIFFLLMNNVMDKYFYKLKLVYAQFEIKV